MLQRLELPYRVVALCAGDIGFGSAKTYDLEVWLPAQEQVPRDFLVQQLARPSRRGACRRAGAIRTPASPSRCTRSTAPASRSGRALVAVLENYQNADGSVTVPAALRPYMGGQETNSRLKS